MAEHTPTVQALLDAQRIVDEAWASLAKRPGESVKAHAAFLDYVRMGPRRSLRQLQAQYVKQAASVEQADSGARMELPPTVKINSLFTWSVRYEWQARIADYQKERDRQDQAVAEARRRALQEADFLTGDDLRDLAGQILAQTPQFLKTTRRLVKGSNGQPDREVITVGLDGGLMLRALQLASELQSKALGVAEKHEVTVTSVTADDLAKARDKAKQFEDELLNEHRADGDHGVGPGGADAGAEG